MIEVTCAIIIKGNKVLATQRSVKMAHALKWEFPGGKVKIGESPEKCIHREIQEELGVRIRVEQLLPSVVHYYDQTAIKLIPFVCSMVGETISLKEHKSYQWVDFSSLNSVDWLEADLKIVERIYRMSRTAS